MHLKIIESEKWKREYILFSVYNLILNNCNSTYFHQNRSKKAEIAVSSKQLVDTSLAQIIMFRLAYVQLKV